MSNKTNHPSLFTDARVKESAIQIALLGHTDVEICKILSIAPSKFNLWKHKDTIWWEALKESKVNSDSEVEKSLRKRAMGYDVVETHITKEGQAIETNKHIPPDTVACIFWLKNREPERWRDRQEISHSGNIQYQYKDMTDDELIARSRKSGLDLPERIKRRIGTQSQN